jgi:hypothetical protein
MGEENPQELKDEIVVLMSGMIASLVDEVNKIDEADPTDLETHLRAFTDAAQIAQAISVAFAGSAALIAEAL